MKLIIKRDQKAQTGIFGGHKGMIFILSCKVELTPAERELIDKYKAGAYPLTYRTTDKGVNVASLYIENLVRGVSYEVKDIQTLLSNEEVIKDACKEFKTLLLVMSSFGGEEVIEY